MTRYTFVRRLNDGLVILCSEAYGAQLWTRRKARKSGVCQARGVPFDVGALVWGTLNGSAMNRMHRITDNAIVDLEHDA